MSAMGYKTEEDAIVAATTSVLNNSGFIEFDGMNCNVVEGNNCLGWDGESYRCDCGNRRVRWAVLDQPDGTFIAYATAD